MSDKKESIQARQVTDETILKVAKEIVVKFIEVGRVTPASFDETFSQVFNTIKNKVKG